MLFGKQIFLISRQTFVLLKITSLILVSILSYAKFSIHFSRSFALSSVRENFISGSRIILEEFTIINTVLAFQREFHFRNCPGGIYLWLLRQLHWIRNPQFQRELHVRECRGRLHFRFSHQHELQRCHLVQVLPLRWQRVHPLLSQSQSFLLKDCRARVLGKSPEYDSQLGMPIAECWSYASCAFPDFIMFELHKRLICVVCACSGCAFLAPARGILPNALPISNNTYISIRGCRLY